MYVGSGRYELLRHVARGAHGEVWRARDELTGASVAIKLLEGVSRSMSATVRREVAALRAVQVPGVVRLLDEGVEGEHAFVVMEYVEGRPFPACARPAAWRDIAETTLALLEIIARIHATGVVHRDLKPDNVLVQPDGRPVVLDFGISWSALDLDGGAAKGPRGTPAYMAPEQAMGGTVGPYSDLYALGVMLFETLSGSLPFEGENPMALMAARCFREPTSLHSFYVDAPDAVIDTVDALLQRDPAKRPQHARDLQETLAGRVSTQVPAFTLDGAHFDDDSLRALFLGHERVFHVPSDAASLLFSQCGGERRRTLQRIESWVRTGQAQWIHGRVRIDRETLDRLLDPSPELDTGATLHARAEAHREAAARLTPGTPGRLHHLIRGLVAATRGGVDEVLREALACAWSHAREGRSGRALAALAEGWLAALRVAEPVAPHVARDLFEAWAEIAVLDATPASIDRALYELARAPEGVPVDDLTALLHAWLAARSGGDRGLALADAVPAFASPGLEICRQCTRVLAARRCTPEVEARVLAEIEAWRDASPHGPNLEAALFDWKGRVAYRQHRFDEAADWHARAADVEPLVLRRLGWLAGAGTSAFDAAAPQRVLGYARALRALARDARHAYAEAWSEYLERGARLQLGEALTVDHALIDAVAALHHDDLLATVHMTEAAIAYRGGDHPTAATLAARAGARWHASGWANGRALCRALEVRCGVAVEAAELEALGDWANAHGNPRIALQVMASMARGLGRVPDAWAAGARRHAAIIPAERWRTPFHFLSTHEALSELSSAPRADDASYNRGADE